MGWPGESLLIKLWETLADKGVGGLLKPWQIKREAKAQIEARRMEIVALADAEREAEEIRSGRMKIVDSRYVMALDNPKRLSRSERVEPTIETRPALEVSTASMLGDALRQEVNIAKAITYAEEELKDDPQAAPDRDIDPDWLFRWRNSAGSVSSDDLQSLWGRVLAGEVKAPGSFSYRTLEFIKNLSTEEAKRIERLSRFVITDFIARDQKQILADEGVSFQDLLEMQDLGVISGVESVGLSITLTSVEQDKFVRALCAHGRVLMVKHSDPSEEFKVKAYVLTSIGRQVMKLGKFIPNERYLRAVGEELKRAGAEVAIGDYKTVSEEKIRIFNEQAL